MYRQSESRAGKHRCVLPCFRRSSARWVLLAVAGCLGPCSCVLLFLCCCSALVGWLSGLECAFRGYQLALALLHLFLLLRLFVSDSVTKRRDG